MKTLHSLSHNKSARFVFLEGPRQSNEAPVSSTKMELQSLGKEVLKTYPEPDFFIEKQDLITQIADQMAYSNSPNFTDINENRELIFLLQKAAHFMGQGNEVGKVDGFYGGKLKAFLRGYEYSDTKNLLELVLSDLKKDEKQFHSVPLRQVSKEFRPNMRKLLRGNEKEKLEIRERVKGQVKKQQQKEGIIGIIVFLVALGIFVLARYMIIGE